MEDWETDAASVGTAVHSAIETCIDSGGLTLVDTLDLFAEAWVAQQELPNFVWKKYTPAAAAAFGENCIMDWWHQVLPTLDLVNCETEWNFLVPLVDDDQRVIELSGTADYVCGSHIIDWKTSSRAHQAWEKKRYAIQPSVYTYALHVERGVEAPTFGYCVMHPKGVQQYEAERDQRHWGFMADVCVALAQQIEAELPQWPLTADGALCGPMWCPAWNTCRGAWLGPDPW